MKDKSLFQKLGGVDCINKVVDRFYDKIISDNELKHFFSKTSMKAQATKQKAFLAYVFGAPSIYDGKTMREAHVHLQITGEHFNRVAFHLIETLKEYEIEQNLIEEVVKIVESTRKDVIGK